MDYESQVSYQQSIMQHIKRIYQLGEDGEKAINLVLENFLVND